VTPTIHYAKPSDASRLRTWKVETVSKEFLVAVPLWADVETPIMTPTDNNSFQDSAGSSWKFQIGGDGKVKGVTQIFSNGAATEMTRVGDPYKY